MNFTKKSIRNVILLLIWLTVSIFAVMAYYVPKNEENAWKNPFQLALAVAFGYSLSIIIDHVFVEDNKK